MTKSEQSVFHSLIEIGDKLVEEEVAKTPKVLVSEDDLREQARKAMVRGATKYAKGSDWEGDFPNYIGFWIRQGVSVACDSALSKQFSIPKTVLFRARRVALYLREQGTPNSIEERNRSLGVIAKALGWAEDEHNKLGQNQVARALLVLAELAGNRDAYELLIRDIGTH